MLSFLKLPTLLDNSSSSYLPNSAKLVNLPRWFYWQPYWLIAFLFRTIVWLLLLFPVFLSSVIWVLLYLVVFHCVCTVPFIKSFVFLIGFFPKCLDQAMLVHRLPIVYGCFFLKFRLSSVYWHNPITIFIWVVWFLHFHCKYDHIVFGVIPFHVSYVLTPMPTFLPTLKDLS